jgi:hypothetical protein
MDLKKAKKKTLTSVILNVETENDTLIEDNSKWCELDRFTKTLNEGISTILIRHKQPGLSFRSSLASLLGFAHSLEDFDKEDVFQKGKNLEEVKDYLSKNKPEGYWEKADNSPFSEQVTQPLFRRFPLVKLSIEEESLSEVIYIERPRKYAEISYNVKAIVVSNNIRNILLCDHIELDYIYQDTFEAKGFDFHECIEFLKERYDLIIFDLIEHNKQGSASLFPSLKKYEDVLLKISDDICYYVAVSPFAKDVNPNDIIDLWKLSDESSDKKYIKLAERLRPRQTWEYLNGEINEKFRLAEKDFLYLFFYESTGSRRDEIKGFEMLLRKQNWNKLGNKLINCNVFFREIVFKLGKLPKFGA